MEEENIETKRVTILRDSKQTRITIPDELVEKFDINPETDEFEWVVWGIDKISLTGKLIKNAKKKD